MTKTPATKRRTMLAALFTAPVLLLTHSVAAAALTGPTLNSPAGGATDWLFNVGTTGVRQTFSWSPVSGATSYEFVLSRDSGFANYSDGTGSCSASGCVALSTTATTAGAAKFAGFLFEARTYYWKVRAIANGIRGPWSVTRSFATTSRANIVTAALAYGNSPQSRVDRADGGTVPWLTELDASYLGDNVDGKLLANAWTIYGFASTPRSLGTASSPTALRTKMRSALYRSGGWALAERDALIDRIAATYFPASLTRNGMLATLGIRAQCKEFADRMVISGGATPRTYSGMGSARLDPRPGMYITWKLNQHAAIANAVVFDTNGQPSVRLSESNWGNTWGSNPVGQVPWQRVVKHSRQVVINATSDYRAYVI